jgi:hypothetical protein
LVVPETGARARRKITPSRTHYNNGILSIAAAGNAGNTAKSYPASYASVISVAAVDSAGVVASFSQKNDAVELAAPGVAVRSTVPMGTGTNEESLSVDGATYEAIALDGSSKGCRLRQPGGLRLREQRPVLARRARCASSSGA